MTEHLTERQQEIVTPQPDWDAEIADCLKAQEGLVALLSKAAPKSVLWDILAGACDEVSDHIGVLQIRKGDR